MEQTTIMPFWVSLSRSEMMLRAVLESSLRRLFSQRRTSDAGVETRGNESRTNDNVIFGVIPYTFCLFSLRLGDIVSNNIQDGSSARSPPYASPVRLFMM